MSLRYEELSQRVPKYIHYRGFVWEFDARQIANDRAQYLEDRYPEGHSYNYHFFNTLEDMDEIKDWMVNNMDIADIDLELIETPDITNRPDMFSAETKISSFKSLEE